MLISITRAWFAKNGYTCLTIDTIQRGEIQGVHHGTYSHNRWWWNARGYTPAGVEAWNCIRALDYLETRPEVDSERFGVTGRSGGGAYSWWIAALDDRIKCAVPVAGITSLRNLVVDGCVEGHCDCMFMVNTFGWDYAKVAALVAPRPLLISNSDKDTIFPLEGVVDIHQQVRHIYQLYGKPRQHGLHITEGPHLDTQELRIHAFRWFNRWLKKDESLIDKPAVKYFQPPALRVFDKLPNDERVTTIDEDFVPMAPAADKERVEYVLSDSSRWFAETATALKDRCFRAWPVNRSSTFSRDQYRVAPLALNGRVNDNVALSAFRLTFVSQEHVSLQVDILLPQNASDQTDFDAAVTGITAAQLMVLDTLQWKEYRRLCLKNPGEGVAAPSANDNAHKRRVTEQIMQQLATGRAVAVFAARGQGPHTWAGNRRKQTQIRRRFQLIGTTADTMRVWDICQVVRLLNSAMPQLEQPTIVGHGKSGWLALTATLFCDGNVNGHFTALSGHRDRMPVYLNRSRTISAPELLALAMHKNVIKLTSPEQSLTDFAPRLAGDGRWTGVRRTSE